MIFERTFDYALVKAIITHPAIYPHVSDDASPSVEQYEPIESEQIWYIKVTDDGEILGIWILVPENAVCWKIHTCLLPTAWGKRAAQAGKEVIQWIWQNTKCVRIITDVPETNRLALMFALKAGLTRYGVNQKSYIKGGKLLDQVVLGISKGEAECQS